MPDHRRWPVQTTYLLLLGSWKIPLCQVSIWPWNAPTFPVVFQYPPPPSPTAWSLKFPPPPTYSLLMKSPLTDWERLSTKKCFLADEITIGTITMKLVPLFYQQLIANQMPGGTFALPTVLEAKSVYEGCPTYSYKGRSNRCAWAKFEKNRRNSGSHKDRMTVLSGVTSKYACW